MASKLELRFKSPGVAGEQFTVKTGVTYTFKDQRNGFREVGIYDPYAGFQTHFAVASNFRDAYNQDDNYLNQSTVTMQEVTTDASGGALPEGTSHWLVIIENFENDFFAGHGAGTSFMDATLTTTTQEVEPSLIVTMEAAANPCVDYKLTIDTNVVGTIRIRKSGLPDGNYTDIASDGTIKTIELPRHSQSVTGVVEVYESGSAFPVLSYLFNMPGVLSISSVDVEGSPFGAMATIYATSGLTLEYSLNGTTWQGSNQYGGLLAGNFTAYVRDSFGCQKTRDFVVTEEQASKITVPPYFEIAKHNAIHFVDRNHDNFLGHISEDIKANAPIRVVQDWLQMDSPRTQFKSSHKNHIVKLYGCGSEYDVPVLKKSSNINRINIYEGNIIDKEGRMAVHFTQGNIYNEDGTVQSEGHVLNGRLPLWYQAGLYLNVEGIGVTKIINIVYEDNIAYAVTSSSPVGTQTSKKITSIHSEHPYEVYEFNMPVDLPEGNYIFEVDYGGSQPWISEIQRINKTLNEQYLKVTWWNDQMNDQLNYSTGIRPFRWLKYDKYFNYIGQNEREIHSGDTSISLVKSKSKAVYELDFRPTAMEVARGLIDGLNHANRIDINGAVFICHSSAKPENFGNWYFVKTELALIGQNIESVEADLTEINVQFLKVQDDASGVGFLQV